jgi:hypothetical protein
MLGSGFVASPRIFLLTLELFPSLPAAGQREATTPLSSLLNWQKYLAGLLCADVSPGSH